MKCIICISIYHFGCFTDANRCTTYTIHCFSTWFFFILTFVSFRKRFVFMHEWWMVTLFFLALAERSAHSHIESIFGSPDFRCFIWFSYTFSRIISHGSFGFYFISLVCIAYRISNIFISFQTWQKTECILCSVHCTRMNLNIQHSNIFIVSNFSKQKKNEKMKKSK